jgi:hypothetical protein
MMKKIIVIMFLNLVIGTLSAEQIEQQNFIIKILDTNNELISGAKITINGTNEVYYTNSKGECHIPSYLLHNQSNIVVDYISYKSKQIQLSAKNSKIIIEKR